MIVVDDCENVINRFRRDIPAGEVICDYTVGVLVAVAEVEPLCADMPEESGEYERIILDNLVDVKTFLNASSRHV